MTGRSQCKFSSWEDVIVFYFTCFIWFILYCGFMSFLPFICPTFRSMEINSYSSQSYCNTVNIFYKDFVYQLNINIQLQNDNVLPQQIAIFYCCNIPIIIFFQPMSRWALAPLTVLLDIDIVSAFTQLFSLVFLVHERACVVCTFLSPPSNIWLVNLIEYRSPKMYPEHTVYPVTQKTKNGYQLYQYTLIVDPSIRL